MRKNIYLFLFVAFVVLVMGYQLISKAYYKIVEPLYLERHCYISTEVEKRF